MRALRLVLIALALAAPVGACRKAQPTPEQNAAIDINTVSPNDIEALPPDESSETSSNELVNGADNADVGDLNASSNGY
jgi:hypothetical protein